MYFLELVHWPDLTMTRSCLGKCRNILLTEEICTSCTEASTLQNFLNRKLKRRRVSIRLCLWGLFPKIQEGVYDKYVLVLQMHLEHTGITVLQHMNYTCLLIVH